MATDYTPRQRAGAPMTGFASAAQVLGGRYVKQTATITTDGDIPVGHAAAGQAGLGVAEYDSAPTTLDAGAIKRRVSITRPGDHIRWKVGTAGITFGAILTPDANGLAITANGTTDYVAAVALQTVSANAEFVLAIQISPRVGA